MYGNYMTPEQFVYWLQGFVELHPSPDKEWSKNWSPDGHQWQIIQDHLKLVFKKETPEYKLPFPVKVDPNIKPTEWRFETMPQYHDLFKPRENNLPGYGPAIC